MGKFKLLSAIIIVLALVSCKEVHTHQAKKAIENKSKIEAIDSSNYYWLSFLKRVNEKDISNKNKEVYRFCYGDFQGHHTFMFIIKDDSIPTLTFKIIFSHTVYCDKKGNCHFIDKDSVTLECTQNLTENKYYHFRSLLWGTYFYAIKEIPEDCYKGWIIDEDGYTLETRFINCDDKWEYKKLDFRMMRKGGFSEVWNYLVNTSDLNKNYKQDMRSLLIK